MTLSSLCQQSLVLVHVGVTLVPGVVGVAHGHLGGGGQGHHGRGLDILLHVGGEGVKKYQNVIFFKVVFKIHFKPF